MSVSAYDSVADWYAQWADWPTALFGYARHLLPERLSGFRVLDVACGHGRLSRDFAAAGASVVGIDLSAELIGKARSLLPGPWERVSYHHADIADLDAWWDGTPFDGIACAMAVMDIADLDSVARAVATVLRPDGWFVASMVHPCFPGNEAGLASWPPEAGYAHEGYWTSDLHNPEGIRIRLGSYHRTLATYVNTLIAAGLAISAPAEPEGALPQFLAIACRRATG
jgi:2-polyprenyl-3-methyl-5-hydroxy-6-metoxy-1,4-benzoquinol methylase